MGDTMTLHWHLRHRGDQQHSEYATDDEGRPQFLIQDNNTLYQAQHVPVHMGTIDIGRIEWIPVWAFDSLERARNEAELMHQFWIFIDDSTEPFPD